MQPITQHEQARRLAVKVVELAITKVGQPVYPFNDVFYRQPLDCLDAAQRTLDPEYTTTAILIKANNRACAHFPGQTCVDLDRVREVLQLVRSFALAS